MKRDGIALAILAAIITLFFIDVLAGYNALYLRDLSHYYYPAKHVLREIVRGGEFPYWNPLLAGGQPMAANPEHEVFYPLTWLILLPDYDLGFRLLVLLHVYIAAWTMYALLRSMRCSRAAAFFGALSFALGGAVLSCIVLLPILLSLAWLPLTCLFTRRFLLDRRPRHFVFAALALGIQVLVGEPTTIAQTGFVLGVYALFQGAGRGARGAGDQRPAVLRPALRALRPLLIVALIAIAAFAVGMVTLLPAIDHARDSVRAHGFAFQFVTTWSTPPLRLAELVFPDVLPNGGAKLYERGTPFLLGIYPGLLVATLLVAGLVLRARGAGITATILVASWLLALGHHTPIWRWLYDAGLARSVRFPEKFLLMGLFAATVFAARMLDDARVRRVAIYVSAAIAIIALVRWSPVAMLLAALLALLLRNFEHRAAVALTAVFILLDLGLQIPKLAPRMPSEYLAEPPLLARRLPAQRDAWRLMHVIEWQTQDVRFRPFTTGPELYWIRRNALRPMMPARWGIRTVMEADYDQTALLPTTDFVEAAWWLAHVRRDWPGIIAPMANAHFLGSYDDPRTALARVNGDRRIVQPVKIDPLGNNPRYYFAERVETIRDVRDFGEKLAKATSTRGVAYVLRTAGVPPADARASRARIPGRRDAGPSAGGTPAVRSVRETANTNNLRVTTPSPALLVMSVTPHKYWRITIDDRPVAAIGVNVGFQGVVVPEGEHRVEMRYRNPLIAIGGAISAAALLALGFVAITMRAL